MYRLRRERAREAASLQGLLLLDDRARVRPGPQILILIFHIYIYIHTQFIYIYIYIYIHTHKYGPLVLILTVLHSILRHMIYMMMSKTSSSPYILADMINHTLTLTLPIKQK